MYVVEHLTELLKVHVIKRRYEPKNQFLFFYSQVSSGISLQSFTTYNPFFPTKQSFKINFGWYVNIQVRGCFLVRAQPDQVNRSSFNLFSRILGQHSIADFKGNSKVYAKNDC